MRNDDTYEQPLTVAQYTVNVVFGVSVSGRNAGTGNVRNDERERLLIKQIVFFISTISEGRRDF
jgi:hypothetical protein